MLSDHIGSYGCWFQRYSVGGSFACRETVDPVEMADWAYKEQVLVQKGRAHTTALIPGAG